MTGSAPLTQPLAPFGIGGDVPELGSDPEVRELLLVSTGMVSIPPINGGAVEAYVADLARIFSGRPGYHVSVISNHRAPITGSLEIGPRWVPTHSPIDSFPLRPAPSALAHAIGGSITAAVAYRHLDRIGAPDGTIVHLNEEVSAMAFARTRRPIRRIFTIHNPPPSTGERGYGGMEYILRQANARATWRFALRQMDAVIALTPWIRRLLVEEWQLEPDRVHVLPLPVDTTTFSPGPAAPATTPWNLLFVGRLEARKNVLAAVDALRYLPETTRLTVVGDGPMAAATRDRARALGLEGRLEIRQRVPVHGLVDQYRTSTLLLHPAHLEAYPRVVVEAAACGLPSIVPDHPMYRSFLEGGCSAAYAPSEGAEGLAAAVVALAADAGRMAEARGRARDYALATSSYDGFGDRLGRIYDLATP